MGKLSTVQNGGFPNILSFHIIHYTLFSSLKNICKKKDFHVARRKRPFHVGCQDKSGPGKIHEVILVQVSKTNLNHNVLELIYMGRDFTAIKPFVICSRCFAL